MGTTDKLRKGEEMMNRTKRVLGLAIVLLTVFTIIGFAKGRKEAQAKEEGSINLATLIYGSIQDADYSTLGYMTAQAMAKRPEVGKTAFSEKVGAPDAVRVMEEYINAGYNVVWAHSSIYTNAVYEICDKYPNVSFILEGDAAPTGDKVKSNVWLMERNYYIGFYVLGQLATLQTQTKKVAFVGAVKLPFQIGIIKALNQSIKEHDPSVEFKYIFVGDFDDPVKARQTAEALISQGYDVLLSALTLGNYGLFEAAMGKPVWITTEYTDKQHMGPKNYLSSEIFDFTIPLNAILDKINEGRLGGHHPLEYGLAEEGKPRYTQLPAFNAPESVNQILKQTARKVSSGEIKVVKNLKDLPF
jgi:basic membrane protein A